MNPTGYGPAADYMANLIPGSTAGLIPGGYQPAAQAPATPPPQTPASTVQPNVNPMDYYTDPSLQAAQTAYTSAATQAGTSAQEEATLPQMLRSALAMKFGENNPLMADRSKALTNYLNVTQNPQDVVGMGANNGVVFNPSQQADLLGKAKNAALGPLVNANELLALGGGGIQNIIDAAAGLAHAQTAGFTAKADIAKTAYSNLFQELSAKAQTAVALRGQNLQYGDPDTLAKLADLLKSGGSGTSGTTGGSGTTGTPQDLASLRSKLQQMYTSTLNPNTRMTIENTWKALSGGKPLIPQTLDANETTGLSNQTGVLRDINTAIALLASKNTKTQTGGLQGTLNAYAITKPFNLPTRDLTPLEIQKLNDIFIGLGAAGTKQLIGGRLQAILQKLVGPAFPSLTSSNQANLQQLYEMQREGMADLQNVAQTKGMLSSQELPNYTNSFLHLKDNKTGQIFVSNDPNDYDPSKNSIAY
jgi:hypothetical protein